MRYIEVKIITSCNDIDAGLEKLANLGIFDVQIDDPREILDMIANLDDTEWYSLAARDGDLSSVECENVTEVLDEDEKGSITVYLDDSVEGQETLNSIKKAFDTFDIEISEKDDSEWRDKWKEYYHPAKVSDRIIVSPTWAKEEEIQAVIEEESIDSILIRLDPGMAFGTGTHETTSLSLRMMEKSIRPKMKVLDVGTGSGILAIAAVKLGAKEILAIDIDEEAVNTAKENIAVNFELNVEDDLKRDTFELQMDSLPVVKVIKADLTEGVDFIADVLVANLLTDLIIRFAPDVPGHLTEDGFFIASGILAEKKDKVINAVEEAGMRVIEIMEDGDWCGLTARRAK